MYRWIFATNNSPALFFIRIALGVVMFPHGAQMVFGWFGGQGYAVTLKAFVGFGFPVWSVVVLMFFDSIGALFLIIGFVSRLWALGIGFAIAVCMLMYHIPNGFFMNWFGQQKGEGFEYHLLVIGISLAIAISGGGWLSLDRKIAGR